MWKCLKCGAIIEDSSNACYFCRAVRDDAGFDPASTSTVESATTDESAGAESMPLEAELLPSIEPPVASTLAAWVWMLAVFAFFPILGLVPTLALMVVSIVVAVRRERYRWDRRIGVAGLIIALTSLGIAGLWVLMLVRCAPSTVAEPGEFMIAEEPTWPVIALQLGVLVVSIVLHECGHAVAAYWSGDGTAARLGRIRLNPLAHVDLFGSIILPAILLMTPGTVLFGWAKPVPVNRRQFRSPRLGLLAVTLAGVSLNMMLALACAAGLLAVGSILRMTDPAATSDGFMIPWAQVKLHGVANAATWEFVITGLKQGMLVNLVLFSFNILPIPPLDGYGVLESVAPAGLSQLVAGLRPIGSILLIVLVVSGVMGFLLLPGIIVGMLLNGLVGAMTGWA